MRFSPWMIVVLLIVAGCSSPTVRYSQERSLEQGIQEVGRTEAEREALREFAAAHPDLRDRPFLGDFLWGVRAAERRRQALAIEFRHKYPNLTPAEAHVLIDDQMARESEALFSMPSTGSLSIPQGIDCTSLRFNNMTHTSCN